MNFVVLATILFQTAIRPEQISPDNIINDYLWAVRVSTVGKAQLVPIFVDSSTIIIDKSTTPWTLKVFGNQFIDEEVPSGVMDGVNQIYTIVNSPAVNSLKVYYNGLRLRNNIDYTVSGTTITLKNPFKPNPGDVLLVDYRK